VLLEDVGNVLRLGELFSNAAYDALAMGGDRDARDFADRAAPIVRDLDSPRSWMILCGNLGLAALLTGDTDAARAAFREELELCRGLVARRSPPKACLGLPRSPSSMPTSAMPRGFEAPRRLFATNRKTTSRRDSRRRSSQPPARATEPTPGTPPSGKGLN
jgi:hypothetical protein